VVSSDVAALLDRAPEGAATEEEQEALALLAENGFLVPGREEDRRALDEYFRAIQNDTSELNVTVLTTLQCNFACDYCYQGDREDYNQFAEKMSLDTAAGVAGWIEGQLERNHPARLVLTFFGGEPLLNLPVVYFLAERVWQAAASRGVPMRISIITNGLLLTREVVDRLVPFGLQSAKITLDGDHDTHDRMRPLRGGQGTFDRIIANIRQVAGRIKIAIGGNFDESSVDSYPALLQFLREQEFADKLVRVNFKPVVRNEAPQPKGMLTLTPVGADGKPLNGTCMTSVGKGGGSTCDTCSFLDEKMEFLRQETARHGFPTADGVHNGPCHVHHKNAHTIGPDGSLYGCPGFTGEKALSTGHIDGRLDAWRNRNRDLFDRLDPWKACGDCAFIPVCAGGCLTASYSQLGDVNTPTCHKPAFESALITLAHQVASAADGVLQ
jgi:uncharacterized protein